MTDTANAQGGLGGLLGGTSADPTQVASTLGDILGGATGTGILSGGTATGLDQNAIFDPTMFGGGGVLSPTGVTGVTPISSPQVAAAQQDPSGQITPDAAGQVDRTGKGDRATTPDITAAQTVDRTNKADALAAATGQPPAGPTGLGGPQPIADQKKPQVPPSVDAAQPATPAAAGQQAAASPLAQLARSQRQAANAAAQPAAAAPTAAPQPGQQPAAPPQPPSRQAPTGGGPTAPPSQAPPAPVPQGAGGAGAPMPDLLRAILSLLGIPTGGRGALGDLARQAGGGGLPTGPLPPTSRIGPFGRARAAARRDDGTDEAGSTGPPPGTAGEVSAPTAQQVGQTRLAGTDTPPTEGFSEALRSDRAKFAPELESPRTKWETLAILALEHEHDPAAVAESLLNRADYAKTSIHNMIHSGFYGPVNHGMLARTIRNLQTNPQRTERLAAGLETAMRGSNLLGGATDQGSRNDPNVGWRGGKVMRFGETYNDWGGGPGFTCCRLGRKGRHFH